ncbi:MAG: hypothetical protein G3M78_00670 [Candidatus Nitrohelix vancouverensis]|uniref:Uncharacterized protein n=1 Tax=Candidatus Nitrohelix vancouverensis TaxID=2705534 RepID=A0A7T0C087_9BACT|nr:MAG: hypothetical protein G3M78_00670 [Candidatus Nitrohelix vancouverensis]
MTRLLKTGKGWIAAALMAWFCFALPSTTTAHSMHHDAGLFSNKHQAHAKDHTHAKDLTHAKHHAESKGPDTKAHCALHKRFNPGALCPHHISGNKTVVSLTNQCGNTSSKHPLAQSTAQTKAFLKADSLESSLLQSQPFFNPLKFVPLAHRTQGPPEPPPKLSI